MLTIIPQTMSNLKEGTNTCANKKKTHRIHEVTVCSKFILNLVLEGLILRILY
jgi:hypothetical protein